jgi:hypothetical protein
MVQKQQPKRKEGLSPVQALFGLEEGRLLLEAQDKTKRLRQLHQQIVVLRGVALNGFVLLAVSLFGLCAQKHKTLGTLAPEKRPRWPAWLLYSPTVVLILGACVALAAHFSQHVRLDDPPVLELALLALGLFGLIIIRFKTVNQRPYSGLSVLALSIVLLAYSGWLTTEARYDAQIIYSFSVLNGK